MAARLHNYFHTSQGTPSLNPNNAVILPQDPSGQQQQQEATETSPPAGNNLSSRATGIQGKRERERKTRTVTCKELLFIRFFTSEVHRIV